MQGTDGNFYGTTHSGGGGAYAFGTVFRITPTGSLTTLHSFCSQPNCADGALLRRALVQGASGNFYATTSSGGTSWAGTVFKITLAGLRTTLHSFNVNDGYDPEAALVQASDGNFYGTTWQGGS